MTQREVIQRDAGRDVIVDRLGGGALRLRQRHGGTVNEVFIHRDELATMLEGAQ